MNFKIDIPAMDETQNSDCTDSTRRVAMPFDLGELDDLPQPTAEDPPYRPWWVVDRS